jgi:trehalose 6-phosphate phosphatase
MADLDQLASRAVAAGIFCDFDGCLAPIVPDPDDAQPLPGAVETLERLAARFKVVAIVSGRSAADLTTRVRATGVRLIGLPGLEDARDGAVVANGVAERFRGAVERAAARLERELVAAPGAVLERKGLALAVHFRRAPQPGATEQIATPIVLDVARDEGLVVAPGRLILEARPPGGGNKGDAIRRIVAADDLTAALVGGDDVGDLAAFDAVAEVEVGVRVAVLAPESPRELAAKADVAVDSPRAFVALLAELAGAVAL